MRTQTELRSRQKIAADNMTPVAKFVRALQSGQLKSELRTVQEVIHAASALYKQIEAGALRKTSRSQTAYLTPDLSMLFTRKYVPGKESEIQAELSGQCCIWAGLVFGIRDPGHGGDWLMGARPF